MLRISDDEITSDEVTERARRTAEGWRVDGHPGRVFDRNEAITAVSLAEVEARPAKSAEDDLLIEAWLEELGLS